MTARGFTLVEVLVALAIVAITLGAGLRVSGSQINSAERQGDMLRAQLCAENELVKLRLFRQLPDTGDKRFVCQQAGQTLEGKLAVMATPNPSFRKVDAFVFKSPTGSLTSGNPASTNLSPEPYTLIRLSTIVGRF
jgi:general secretion pathway protein I